MGILENVAKKKNIDSQISLLSSRQECNMVC